MKKFLVLSISAVLSTSAFAGTYVPTNKSSPTFMVGISVEFGDGIKTGDIGFTGKVVSTNRPNEFVIGGGVSYFPWSTDKTGPVGLDLSAGYNFDHVTAMGGYDLLRWKPQISVGYTPTEEEHILPPG